MGNPVKIANNFFKNPDNDSKAKCKFAYYYFGLYLKIIDYVRNRFAPGKQIVYLDFFAGKGKFETGEESVPLKVLESARNIEKIRFHFNDLNCSSELISNIKDKFGYQDLPNNIVVTSEDARNIRVSSMFTSDDIVISYIDSFSYLLCDVNTVRKLITNRFSDAVIFLNVEHFYRFLNQEKEKASFIKFFGSEDNYERFRQQYKTTSKDKTTIELISDYIKRLSVVTGSQLYCLPIFFRKKENDSIISQVLIVISKSKKGPMEVREKFTEIPKNESQDQKLNRDFYFEDGRMTVYFDSYRNQLSLFDEDFDKYKKILDYLPKSKETAVTCEQLLDRIDNACLRKHFFLSGYTNEFLKRALNYFENKGFVGVDYRPKKKMKRKPGTFGNCSYIYLLKENNNENN